jgi:hypothetical protein
MSTVDPSKAVFFDFDFTVAQENIASVSISIADEGELKIFFSKVTFFQLYQASL